MRTAEVASTAAGADECVEIVPLRPPRHPLDPRVVAWWRARLLLTGTAVVLPLVVGAGLVELLRPWLLAPGALVATTTAVATVLLPPRWFRLARWEVTDHAVYSRRGYLLLTWRIAPLSRIQTVDTSQGPLQRRFGLATVVATTASAVGAVAIIGLDQELATDLAHRLTLVTDATPGDAT